MDDTRPVAAILYDFDKTLSTTDMQDYTFIPSLGLTPAEFWRDADAFGHRERMDGVLAYMFWMVREARRLRRPFGRADLVEKGRDIVLLPGVPEWFPRVTAYGDAEGLRVEHYVISSGLREIIEGCPIGGAFREIFASEFLYDGEGRPVWPKLAVNYTNKTQFIYRINKGVPDPSDDRALNDSMPDEDKRVPFTHMVYIGDGLSDVPCMKMMRAYGGSAVAVWQDASRAGVEDLLDQGRVDHIFPADYREGSPLDRTIRDILRSIAVRWSLRSEHVRQMRRIGAGELPGQAGLF